MTLADQRIAALAKLDEYFERGFVVEHDPEVMDLAGELEKVSRAEEGDATLGPHTEVILKRWRERERNARRNLDDVFFERVARATKTLRFLEQEVGASSPPAQFAVVVALQAAKIIEAQKALPSWEFIHLKTELFLAGRYAYLNSDGGADAAKFKSLALKEFDNFRYRAEKKLIKWSAIRKTIGLQGLRNQMDSRERTQIEALKSKLLPSME